HSLFNPAVEGPREVATVDQARVDANGRREQATEIDGNANNTGTRELTRSSTGQPLFIDKLGSTAQVDITRERTAEPDPRSGQYSVLADQLVFKTGNSDDQVKVTQGENGQLRFDVNGEEYDVALARGQQLTVRTGDGNDNIEIDPSVKVNFIIEAGDGDDTIQGGGGNDRIDGGAGNDAIDTGEGFNYAFGGSGEDIITGGDDNNTLYGGDGIDTISGGRGNDYIEGGNGDDVIVATGGKNVLSGGLGDDNITASGNGDRVYTGGGTNTVGNLGAEGLAYSAGVGDKLTGTGTADPNVVNVVLNSDAGLKGVKLEGSEAFVQRVEADLEMLRASPNGQQMLAEFDKSAANGNIVTIRELQNVDNGYAQSVGGSDIRNGQPGNSGPVDISYNPAFAIPELPVPSVTLFHEMSHAYNGVNGTFLPGTYTGPGPDSPTPTRQIPNAERQAVGLETTADPYDFGDGSGPITHNPTALSENGLRAEMGLELRPSYAI
ncbi:MAG TPA: M91 family zinc metallopeptidase, partial [Luteimonas sp.]